MKDLNFKDFMKKYNLKNKTMNESELQEFIIMKFIREIVKYILIKDSLILIMDRKVVLIGLVL